MQQMKQQGLVTDEIATMGSFSRSSVRHFFDENIFDEMPRDYLAEQLEKIATRDIGTASHYDDPLALTDMESQPLTF